MSSQYGNYEIIDRVWTTEKRPRYIVESPNILEMKFISIEELKKEKKPVFEEKGSRLISLKVSVMQPKKKEKNILKKKPDTQVSSSTVISSCILTVAS